MRAHSRSSPPAFERRGFGPYELVDSLAAGGNARLHLARLRGNLTAAPVVIKRVLADHNSPEAIGKLMREASLQRRMDHPNIVRVKDSGLLDEEAFIALEFIDGMDLRALLDRSSSSGQPIPINLAVFIAQQLCSALDELHRPSGGSSHTLYLIHGDVCPANVLLSSSGDVKLADFGRARSLRVGEAATSEGGAVGHFGYVAPEILTGHEFDHRADIFALGALVGELLIGQRVFAGEGHLAVMLSVRDGNIAPLESAREQLPNGLFEVCAKAIRTDPNQRYSSAAEFSGALLPFGERSVEDTKRALGSWVGWAKDESRFVEDLEQRIHESVGTLRALSQSSSGLRAVSEVDTPQSSVSGEHEVRIRRAGQEGVETASFPALVEWLTTGALSIDDEVALWDTPFERVGRIQQLTRYLLASTTAKTSQQYAPGPPDRVIELSDASFLSLLADLHHRQGTATLFVVDTLGERGIRKDIYVRDGRLVHVASSNPRELLGEYLVDKGMITRTQLESALKRLRPDRHLGELLVQLNLVSAVDVFTALRHQGRDRVAELCTWSHGFAQVYQKAPIPEVLFPLDLELPIVIAAGAQRCRLTVPDGVRLRPGPRIPRPGEQATSSHLLTHVPMIARRQMSGEAAISELRELVPNASSLEVQAALTATHALGWIEYALGSR